MNVRLWMYLHAVRNIEKQSTDSTVPEVRLNWHHVAYMKDASGQKTTWLRRDRRAFWEEKGSELFIRWVPCRSTTLIGFSEAFSNRLIDTALSLYYSPSVTSNVINSPERRTKTLSLEFSLCVHYNRIDKAFMSPTSCLFFQYDKSIFIIIQICHFHFRIIWYHVNLKHIILTCKNNNYSPVPECFPTTHVCCYSWRIPHSHIQHMQSLEERRQTVLEPCPR